MPNLSQLKRQRMLAFLDKIKEEHTSVVRSTSEMLFEQHCEKRDDIEWVYKDGMIWIIETKGEESKGKNKNIDDQIENKFIAFKDYAAQQGI